MKKYVFVIPSPHRVNSILQTDIFKFIAAEHDVKTVIVSAQSADPVFQKDFAQAVHIPLAPLNMNFVRRVMRLRDLFLEVNLTVLRRARHTARSVSTRNLQAHLPFPERIAHYVRIVLRPFRPITIGLINWLEVRLLRETSYEDLIRTHKPSAIILGTLTEPQDVMWLALSRRYNIPTYIVDLPWSYLENRLYAVPRPAHIFVWNERMQRELTDRFPVASEYVHITGCQRYDRYATHFPTVERHQFLTSLGIDPEKKLIVYFSASEHWNPYQHHVTELVLQGIELGALPKDTQIVVRRGWKQTAEAEFIDLQKRYPNLIMQNADDFPDQTYASHLLYYSDVALSVFSSLALDAAVLDKPMIYTGLSGLPEQTHDDAVIARVYEYDFVQKALQTNGVRVAYDIPTFTALLTEYFSNPNTDREGRAKLVEQFLGTVDGQAGKRIAQVILQTSTQ
jgi:hypothetical protein